MLGLGLGLQKSTKLGGFVGLLDLYPNAAAAYSLRKLRAAYSGNAIRVRKEVSSVSSETDIGFLADGSLDTVSLLAFASDADSGDVFVVTWYDQSGNGNDSTHSTGANQHLIVSSGVLVLDNLMPSVNGEGKAGYLLDTKITDVKTVIAVGSKLNDTTINYISGSGTSPFTGVYVGRGSLNDLGVYSLNAAIADSSASIADDTQFLSVFDFDTTWKCSVNGSSLSNTSDDGQIDIDRAFGRNLSSLCLSGLEQMLVIYTTSQTSNLSAMQDNINDDYNIY